MISEPLGFLIQYYTVGDELGTFKDGSGPMNRISEAVLANMSAFSLPVIPEWAGRKLISLDVSIQLSVRYLDILILAVK